MRNWPVRNTATPGATSYQATTAAYTFGVWSRTSTATGSASGNTPGHVQAHAALMPPMTRKARRSASRIGPIGVADRPARVRAGEPSRRDTYGRERPPRRGVGVPHQVPHLVPHPPHRLTAPAVKKGGSLPSSPSPLARLVSSGLGRKTRTRTAKNGRVVCHTPPSLIATPPPVSAWHFACPAPCPAPCHGTGINGGHHQIAASGPVSREVDQIWKRSIATRAFVVVGVPSGS